MSDPLYSATLEVGHRLTAEARKTFFKFTVAAQMSLQQCRPAAAAAQAQLAAYFAWRNHPGLFVSGELEGALATISGAIISARRKRADPPSPEIHRVLHVLTQSYPGGGHTRAVWRWIACDGGRRHSVAITAQGAQVIPRPLRDAVGGAGGAVYRLDQGPGGLLRRAALLRALAEDADLIVLHCHPHDILPPLAFAKRGGLRAPVVLYNHADHVFWLGARVSTLVVQSRESGRVLCQGRRGIPAARCAFLPLPLVPLPRNGDRPSARRALGLPEQATLLLSIASGYKYTPVNRSSFARLLGEALRRYPDAYLVLVGPDRLPGLEELGSELAARVVLAGYRTDTAHFYQAADIYVNSFPFTSNTSLLEAGLYGLPLVDFVQFAGDASVLAADDPGFDRLLIRATDTAAFQKALAALLQSPGYRVALGEATREAILAEHTGPRWSTYLEQLYRQAVAAVAFPDDPVDSTPRSDALDATLAFIHHRSGFANGESASVAAQLRYMPAPLRVAYWLQLAQTRARPAPGLLLPDWLSLYYERRFARGKL